MDKIRKKCTLLSLNEVCQRFGYGHPFVQTNPFGEFRTARVRGTLDFRKDDLIIIYSRLYNTGTDEPCWPDVVNTRPTITANTYEHRNQSFVELKHGTLPIECVFETSGWQSPTLGQVVLGDLIRKMPEKIQDLLRAVPQAGLPKLYGASQAVEDPRKISFFNKPEQFNQFLTHMLAGAREAASEYRKRTAVMTRPGRFFAKFGIKDPQLLEEITSIFVDYDFETVSGEDVRKFYRGTRYTSKEMSSLHNSCMRSADCQDYMDVYVDNCEMLVAKDPEGKIYGRAILWPKVNISGDDIETQVISFMDRIYGSGPFQHGAKRWARANGYWHKQEQNYHSHMKVVDPGGNHFDEALMNIEISQVYELYPYMDTFFGLNTTSGHLRNQCWDIDLEDTEGNPTSNRALCSFCDQRLPGDDYMHSLRYNEPICHECWNENYFYCTDCGEAHESRRSTYVGFHGLVCPSCAEEYTCDECGDVLRTLESHNDQNLCATCFEKVMEEEKEEEENE